MNQYKKFSIGDVFANLTIIELLPNSEANTNRRAKVRCNCGQELIVARHSLRSGNTRSCGCLQKEIIGKRSRKHGHSFPITSRTYNSWLNMKTRCLNENTGKFRRYGRRGITICNRWVDSFENFLADMGERPIGRTLERKDNDGHYEPGNCRWATPKEQANNKTQNNKPLTNNKEVL